ncbi:DUF2510 domain-containing protein [Agromyces sp. GXQ0307]|uniref:DUF2510 domain-containing protein n=1 Tax=Agromyces sp. GXQ0307 TaxID=3377835 RepID=UPI00383B8782
MTAADPASAGWHPDPIEPHILRYWDGTGWTPHTASGTDAPGTALTEPALHLTARLPDAVVEHTTLPLAPGAVHAGRADTGRRLALAGALTAAASLLVACAALGIALAG